VSARIVAPSSIPPPPNMFATAAAPPPAPPPPAAANPANTSTAESGCQSAKPSRHT
jgi:hypothetical protein